MTVLVSVGLNLVLSSTPNDFPIYVEIVKFASRKQTGVVNSGVGDERMAEQQCKR